MIKFIFVSSGKTSLLANVSPHCVTSLTLPLVDANQIFHQYLQHAEDLEKKLLCKEEVMLCGHLNGLSRRSLHDCGRVLRGIGQHIEKINEQLVRLHIHTILNYCRKGQGATVWRQVPKVARQDMG